MTGEAEPQERHGANTHENPLEATNLVFNGTLAINGEGYGIVVRCGDRTVLGQIAGMTTNEEKRKSPMSVEIDIFVVNIAILAFIVAVIFFFIALFRSSTLVLSARISSAVNVAIGTFVSFVPEGLPVTVTVR